MVNIEFVYVVKNVFLLNQAFFKLLFGMFSVKCFSACLLFIYFRGSIAQNYFSVEDGIHSAFVVGEGCRDTPLCPTTECTLQLDGVKHTYLKDVPSPGMHFCTFSFPEFILKEKISFDTSTGDPQLLVTWISSLPKNIVILGCIRDEGTAKMNAEAWSALESIGLGKPYVTSFRSSLALIGFKGDWPMNMTRSKTSPNTKVSVSLTYVLPPTNIIVSLASNNMLHITWEPVGTRIAKSHVIYETTSLNSSVNHNVQIVDSASKFAAVGPLQTAMWYSFSMKAPFKDNSTHRIVPSKPYFVLTDNNIVGCSGGIYEFILKVDGKKNTMTFDKYLWQVNDMVIAEPYAYTGFDNVECKPAAFADTKMTRICAGMRDLVTSQMTFTELNVSQVKTMDAWQDSTTPVSGSVSTWNRLKPAGLPDINEICYDGFKRGTSGRRFRFGVNGKVNGNCGDIVIGYGINIGGSDYPSAAVSVSTSSVTTVKRTFGYLLVPYNVDSTWLTWMPWSVCIQCGTGTISRFRSSTKRIGEGRALPALMTETISCKIQDCIPPAPANVAASTVSKRILLLQWSPIPSNVLTNDGKHYVILITKPDGQVGKRVALYRRSSKTIYSLEIFTQYCFNVSLVLISDTQGNTSDTVCARTDESVPLDPPANIKGVNLTAWCLLISWTPIPTARAQGIITKYEIFYQAKNGPNSWSITLSNSNSSEQICGLQPFTAYELKISGYTRIGGGPFSAIVGDIFTDEYVPSKAPDIISTEHTSSTSIKVKWQSLANSYWNGVPVGYTVFYILKDIYATLGVEGNTSFTTVVYSANEIELLQLGKYRLYVIWMTAFTVKGSGMNTTTWAQRTDEDTPIRGPEASAHNSSSFSIAVNWTQLDSQYRLGILLKYRVFCTNIKTGNEVFVDVAPSEIKAELTNLLPFQNHSIEVAGVNSKGVGVRGPAVYTSTEEYKPSVAPPNFWGVNISSYTLEIQWSLIPKDFKLGIILGYTILYKETASQINDWNMTVVYEENVLRTKIYNLTAYTDHSVKIAGFTKMGNGTFSTAIVIRTGEDAPYASPRSFNYTEINATTAVIKWAAPKSSQVKGVLRGYKIVYSAVYRPVDFTSHLLTPKARKRRSVISKPIDQRQHNITVDNNQFELVLQNLQGSTNYSVQILAFTIFEGVISDPLYIFTKENIPAMAPINVTAHNTTYTALMVRWKHIFPAYAHGFIRGFLVFYQLGNHSNAIAYNESQIAERTFLEITHLEIFAWYTIQVAAYTREGVGIKSHPVYARTDEWIPSRAPSDVKAKSFMMPSKFNVTWTHLEEKDWRGVPLGYLVVAIALSAGGVELPPSQQTKASVRVGHRFNSYYFRNMKSFYKYGIKVSAYTRIGDGVSSVLKHLETCNVANSLLRSSWINFMPFVENNPASALPHGFLPPVLSKILKYCSGQCIGLNIKGNATIDYRHDGLGKAARKSNLLELTATMSNDTEFFFPVLKPTFAIDQYKYLEVMSMSKVLLVEGKPLINTIGQNVSSSMSGLLAMLTIFILFCLLAGCIIWFLEIYHVTGEFRRHPITGISDGFYWAFVTATTVGYGDITPSSAVGKIFTMIWSLTGLILIGFLAGILSTVLTSSDSSVVKVTTAPKKGVGMVRGSFEFMVAQKKGMKIDRNYSNYMVLLDNVANGTVKYGIINYDMAKIWTAKLIKDSISVKRTVDLDGSMGVFVTGDARKLVPCFKTQIKEEAAFILKHALKAVEIEASHVSKSLKADGNLTLTVSPAKPEFYSWESQTMQKYIKGGSMFLAVFLMLGFVYEIVRFVKKRKKRNATKPFAGAIKTGSMDFKSPDWIKLSSNIGQGDVDELNPSLCALGDFVDSISQRQLVRDSFNSRRSIIGEPAATNEDLEEETALLIEELFANFESLTDELESQHIKQRLQLQQAKWDLYGTYKYVDPTDYGVPFE